jgi:hypothetical protein
MTRRHLPFLPMLLAGVLPAQKMLTPDGSGRVVQLYDLEQLTGDPAATATKQHWLPSNDDATTSPAQHTADVLRRFVEPPLGPDDDLKPLGARWLALLGSPDQVASLDRLWRTATSRRADLIDIELRLYTVEAKAFAGLKAKLVAVERPGGIGYEIVAEKDEAKALTTAIEAAAGETLVAPRLAVLPLQFATMAVKNQVSYVKDFTLTRAGDQTIADPVVDVVWDGHSIDVISAWQPDGLLGVSVDVQLQELQRPIAQFETTLLTGLPPVQIQLPRVTGVRLRQTAVLGVDSLTALAAQKADGTWFVATLRAGAQK